MTSQPTGRSKQQIIQAIEEVTRPPGFLYILAFLCYRDLFLDPREATERNWRESLSHQELVLLSGLMVKQPLSTVYPSEDGWENQISAVDAHFRELHDAYNAPMIESFKSLSIATAAQPEQSPPSVTTSYGAGDFFAEGIFYDGSGAYDFQYLDLAVKRYEKDAQWVAQHRGFSIETACLIARQLKTLAEARLRTRTQPQSFTDLCDQLVSLFSFAPAEINGLPLANVEAFLETLSLEPGSANQDFGLYGDYNESDARPIIRLGNNRYFLPVYFTLAQSIYESPFYWMSADPDYRDTSFANRGKATVKLAYDMMVQVFGDVRVFQDVRVMKNKSEAVTDIDILAFVGNKAVVLQAKSRKLTQLSRMGSEDKLRADFKAAIQDGYNQAIACRRAILDRSHRFLDNAGRELVLEESLDEAYLIFLTSDNYPSLIRQVEHFLTRKDEEPYPIAISLFDLDVLTFYLKDPFEFVFYERQRAATADYYIADNEVALLACHLRRRLWRTPGVNGETVDASWAQLIDAHFPYARGLHPHTEASEKLLNRWSNEGFKALLQQLKESRIPGFTDAVFMLYEMSSDSADALIDQIEKTKRKTARDGKRHSFSLSLGKGNERGISFVCRPDADMLSQDLFALGASKKYQLRANEWLSVRQRLRKHKNNRCSDVYKAAVEGRSTIGAAFRYFETRPAHAYGQEARTE